MKCDKPKFTVLSGEKLAKSFASSLISAADSIRDLYVQFGLRTYLVSIIRTGWTGGKRGMGVEYVKEEIEVLPTPRLSTLDSVTEILQPVGLDEIGYVMLSEISGRYTEDELLGRIKDGIPLGKDEQVFYEIHFPQKDGNPGIRRRFLIRAAPFYSAERLQWSIQLQRAHEDRTRAGELR